MQKVEKYFLNHCIDTLCEIQREIKESPADKLIKSIKTRKKDSLYLDVLPENILQLKLIDGYDRNIVLITEEKGEFNYQDICNAEYVVFSDPTDRSKQLKIYIENGINRKIIVRESLFENLLAAPEALSLWQALFGSPALLTGACSALTVVRRGEILFSLLLNYITEDIIIACKDFLIVENLSKIVKKGLDYNLSTWKPLLFSKPDKEKVFNTYLAKNYEENLRKTGLFGPEFIPIEKEPGGPARILYLSNLHPDPPGFILSNGEKIGEWIGWLSFCRYNENLVAYSIYPDTPLAKDDILMTPSPIYSIFNIHKGKLSLNYDKLKYLENPSRYREMILVTHKGNNFIRAKIETEKSRLLFCE